MQFVFGWIPFLNLGKSDRTNYVSNAMRLTRYKGGEEEII